MTLAYFCNPGEIVMIFSIDHSNPNDGEVAFVERIRNGKVSVISVLDGRSLLIDPADFIDCNEDGEDNEVEIDFNGEDFEGYDSDDLFEPTNQFFGHFGDAGESAAPIASIQGSIITVSSQYGAEEESLQRCLQQNPKDDRAWIHLAKNKIANNDQSGAYSALYTAAMTCPLHVDRSHPALNIACYLEASQLLSDMSNIEAVTLKIRCLVRAINFPRFCGVDLTSPFRHPPTIISMPLHFQDATEPLIAACEELGKALMILSSVFRSESFLRGVSGAANLANELRRAVVSA